MTLVNDTGIPDDEFALALALQSANARGLKPCRGNAYRNEQGRGTSFSNAAAGCASAALAADDAQPSVISQFVCGSCVVKGNDSAENPCWDHDTFNPGSYTVGHAFQVAMGALD